MLFVRCKLPSDCRCDLGDDGAGSKQCLVPVPLYRFTLRYGLLEFAFIGFPNHFHLGVIATVASMLARIRGPGRAREVYGIGLSNE